MTDISAKDHCPISRPPPRPQSGLSWPVQRATTVKMDPRTGTIRKHTTVRYAEDRPFGFQGLVKFSQAMDGRDFYVEEDFSFVTMDGITIPVEKGFESDLASTPRPFWSLLPPFGTYTEGSLLHDWLYRHKGWCPILIMRVDGHESRFSRITCDQIFLEAMHDSHVVFWQWFLIFLFVRLLGWYAFTHEPVPFTLEKVKK